MKQKDVALAMDLKPVQVRGLVHKMRNKSVPIVTHQSCGMAVCYDKDIVLKEALLLCNHARGELEAARGLLNWLYDGEQDVELTQQEEILKSMLPVIEAQDSKYDSSEEFPFINIDELMA